MPTTIRKAKAADAAECGRIIHAAFAAIAAQHNFPPDFPSAEVATGIASMLIAHPDFYAIVAENDGRILGSNFLDEDIEQPHSASSIYCVLATPLSAGAYRVAV